MRLVDDTAVRPQRKDGRDVARGEAAPRRALALSPNSRRAAPPTGKQAPRMRSTHRLHRAAARAREGRPAPYLVGVGGGDDPHAVRVVLVLHRVVGGGDDAAGPAQVGATGPRCRDNKESCFLPRVSAR